ncbi:hypothetical protein GSI_03260 [Ganoderma sinense ZZ0214-1]|uniref:Uncharacterized protein n=1 Tax=Ganoderma sinense ZZ0214-1 TaxID=1077348 RepID=A0A2G8SL58_9APHY|nr:hypothetical protein GSI_03260 [Ganoderma sinense ZZ0214-1]
MSNDKKKKWRGKCVQCGVPVPGQYDPDEVDENEYEEVDEMGLPPLGVCPHSHRHRHRHRIVSRARLSPEFASVHVSTTASPSASLEGLGHLTPTTEAEAELLTTADYFARMMEGPDGRLLNDEYWASFLDHLRNLAQAAYALATKNSGAFPPIHFDSAIFADLQFAMAVKQAAANGTLLMEVGTLVLANEQAWRAARLYYERYARHPPVPNTKPPPSSRATGEKPSGYTPAPAQDPPPAARPPKPRSCPTVTDTITPITIHRLHPPTPYQERYAGLPWELSLAETDLTLVLNDRRGRVARRASRLFLKASSLRAKVLKSVDLK